MEEQDSGLRALIVSVTTGAMLVLAMFLFWDSSALSPESLRERLVLSVLALIFFATVIIYQFIHTRDSARAIARRMSKDMLTYSHELFSTLYRNSSVPFIVVDGKGIIESTNAAAAKLLNVELDALNTLDAFSFIDSEDQNKDALIPEYFRQGKIVNDVEVKVRRPDGSTRWVLLALFSFKDPNGVRKGLITLIDITKQKMVDKAKTEFVSLASHQLRTQISRMKWNIELLLAAGKDKLTAAQGAYIDKIAHGLERMDMLVGDFLSVSKFELGTLTAQYTTFGAVQFLTGIYEEHLPLALKKHVRIEPNLAGADGSIVSDSHLLHMIVSNLVSNAVKYTPENGTVKLEATLDGSHLTVRVSDTGMGIPKEEEDMIFSKLFRASNAKTQVTDGTGLGLYIVKEAVKILGGTIGFTSQEGLGTTFTVVLPK
jgi:PAS domain S-box-containing protein